MIELPMWVIYIVPVAMAVVGILATLTLLILFASWLIGWLLEGITNLIGLNLIVKEFSRYYKKGIRNGDIVLPKVLRKMAKLRDKFRF